jgi:hypothetical protein
VNPVLQWLQQNPSSFRGFLAAVLTLGVKVWLTATGTTAHLDEWNAAIGPFLDTVMSAITLYGVSYGALHASRGPLPVPRDQEAIIVAAIQGPPGARAMKQVDEATKDIEETHG